MQRSLGGPAARVNERFLTAASGAMPADVAMINAQIVNVFGREIIPGSVAISRGRIAAVTGHHDAIEAQRTIDLEGAYLAPGLIDAHMHVESTMLAPGEFGRLAAARGTTAVIADPHEIANVSGLPGVRWMLEDARRSPARLFFGASSCVPSCHLETSGAELGVADLAELFEDERVVALAEMMNFPGVVQRDAAVLAKVALGLRARGVVDGHAPGLTGRELCAYAAAGISSDHECTSAEEAREKLQLGMRVFIREGSAARNLDALLPAVTEANAHRFGFCTDDRHPGDLQREGHVDHVIRRAVRGGLDPVTAIAMATLHAAEHFGLHELGAIAPGRLADLLVVRDLHEFRVERVLVGGEVVAEDDRCIAPRSAMAPPPQTRVTPPPGFGAGSLEMRAADPPPRLIRVIGMDPHQLVTEHRHAAPTVIDGRYAADPSRDIAKLAVIERHGRSSAREGVGLGFVSGFGLQRGALASTIGHDAHNLAVVGVDDADMLAATREVARIGGGQCACAAGEVLATLPLPIAGLMSDRPAEEVIERQRALLEAARGLGCPHGDPFMPLSFMPLPVIPALKLTDKGLVDVLRFAVVPLEV